jgi:hypothetical protein
MVGNIFAEGEGVRGGANSDDIKSDVVFLIILIPWHHGSDSCGLLILNMNTVGAMQPGTSKVQYVTVRLAV